MSHKNQLNLFGLDLSQWAGRWRRGWAEVFEWLSARRIFPSQSVTLLRHDGRRVIVRVPGFTAQGEAPERSTSAFSAIEIPDHLVLERELVAQVPAQDLLAAVRLEVEATSPFPPEDTVWGWRCLHAGGNSRPRTLIGISSRRLVDAQLEGRTVPPSPEVWAAMDDGYVVLQGYGEERRLALWRRQVRGVVALVALAGLLAAALVMSPLVQKREQVIQAQQYADLVTGRAAPVVAMRDELGRLAQVEQSLGADIESEPDVMRLLDHVTAIVPDSAWLDLFEYQPGRIRISGRADDAAALLQALEAHPLFANVRAPSSIAREPTSGKERFLIEMDLVK